MRHLDVRIWQDGHADSPDIRGRFTACSPDHTTVAPMSIHVRRLSKRFRSNRQLCCALDGVDLAIDDGEMVALIGPSGSGKSTLIRHLAGLVAGDPGEGEISIDGRRVQNDGRIATDIRDARAAIGVIFQQFNLVGRLGVLENVLAGGLHRHPLWRTLSGLLPRPERERAMGCLHRVGLVEKAGQRAATLSGGQQQRVAIARAMFQGARTILADEPIASLDPNSARRVMDILSAINREDGVTVVVSLHQVEVARDYCRRAIALRAGRVVFDGPSSDLDDAMLRGIYEHDLDIDESGPHQPAAIHEPAAVLATA